MSKLDVLLEKTTEKPYFDISLDDFGDIQTTEGLETALLLSVYGEQRASESEVAAPQQRRGWWGNLMNDDNEYEIGSRLWLLYQARMTQETLNSAENFVQNGLQWLVDDNLLDNMTVTGEATVNNIIINIELFRSQNSVFSKAFELWEDTNVYATEQ